MRSQIIYRRPADLKPRPNNPRTHTDRQIQQIAQSIRTFEFLNPVLIDAADSIIAGHGRVEAAKLIGMHDIPTVCVDHLTPAQIRAYVIADNKLAENAGWDRKLLALEFQELSVNLNFDVSVTGFETAEVDLLIQDLDQDTHDEADEVPDVDRDKPAVSRPGDLWRLGTHALFCGDALSRDSYSKLLGSKKAQLIFTDPRMAKKLNLKESRVIISSQRSLTACRPLGFVGRSMAPIMGPRARGGSYGVGTYPSLHHRDRGPRAAATE
jgi:hypothetical protein